MFAYERFDEPDEAGHSFMFLGLGHVDESVVEEAEAWCAERFGPSLDVMVKGCRWWCNGDDIYFRDEVDAFEFRMRWC